MPASSGSWSSRAGSAGGGGWGGGVGGVGGVGGESEEAGADAGAFVFEFGEPVDEAGSECGDGGRAGREGGEVFDFPCVGVLGGVDVADALAEPGGFGVAAGGGVGGVAGHDVGEGLGGFWDEYSSVEDQRGRGGVRLRRRGRA